MFRILSNTSELSGTQLLTLARFAAPPRLPMVELLAGTGSLSGWAEWEVLLDQGRRVPRHTVSITLPRGSAFPVYRQAWGYLFSPAEAGLAVLAHELRHVWQRDRGFPRTEHDADAWGMLSLQKWRLTGPADFSD